MPQNSASPIKLSSEFPSLLLIVALASAPFFLPIGDTALQLFANSVLFSLFIYHAWSRQLFNKELLRIVFLAFICIVLLKLSLS